jgi:hypothetical protein
MKLEDWFDAIFADPDMNEQKGLSVIGTCKDCHHYEAKDTRYDYWRCEIRNENWHRDDGCIRWEKK